MLKTDRLCFAWAGSNSWALSDVVLSLAPGESLLLAGANGSGKSTLCRAVNGLVPQLHPGRMRGTVTTLGFDTRLQPVHAFCGLVGFAGQNPSAQLFCETVADELAWGPESLGLPAPEIARRVAEQAAAFGITHLLERNPLELSGGEQCLVLLAAIGATEPQLLVCDEVFANLDRRHAVLVQGQLARLRFRGTSLILCEHRHELVMELADRVVVLKAGRIVAPSAPAEARLSANHPREHAGGEVPFLQDNSPWQTRPAVLSLRGLELQAGSLAPVTLPDVELQPGTALLVSGSNGSGKTSLLRHLNGLIRPSKGSIKLDGADIQGLPTDRLASRIALVFQDPSLMLFSQTVRAELEAGPRATGRLDQAWLETIAGELGLAGLLERHPLSLSGGEQKRLSIACALALQPSILVLDEPTASLDADAISLVTSLLRRLKQRGMTLVVATHDHRLASAITDTRLDLDELRAAQDASTPTSLRESTAPEPVASVTPPSRLDPRVGLMAALCASTLVSTLRKPASLAVAGLVAAVLALLTLQRLRQTRGPRRGFFSPAGGWLAVIGPSAVMVWLSLLPTASPAAALFHASQFAMFSLTWLLFFALVSATALGKALLQWRLPFSAVFAFTAALNSVQTLRRLLQGIIEAQRSRGLPLRPGLRSLPRYLALALPLLVLSFRHAEHLAEAMEARGFGRPGRSNLRKYRLGWRGALALCIFPAATTALILSGLW